MDPLELTGLAPLMQRARGSPGVRIGIIDGPVFLQHPDLETENFQQLSGGACNRTESIACLHGTFIAGILHAKRASPAPAICPGCTLLIRPIFSETPPANDPMPRAAPDELAAAILECLDAGARIINMSLGLAQPSARGEQALEYALNLAAREGVIVVAAAGNQGTLASTAITRHPWVIPVVACDQTGRPIVQSNLGSSIGKRGVSAPGDRITSLGTEGHLLTLGGTSVAVPFVTGAFALLWSESPSATATQIKLAVTQSPISRRASVVPPLLDATAALRHLLAPHERRFTA